MGAYFMFGCCVNERVQFFPGLSYVIVTTILCTSLRRQSSPYSSGKLYASTSDPVILEAGFLYCSYTSGKVTGNQLLGFCIDTDQRTITFCQPWTQILRSCRGSGASRNIKSGITARVRLILHNVWPSHVRDAQIQDFVGLAFSQFPSLFNSSFREQLVTLCRSFHCRLSHQEIFRFAKGENRFVVLPHFGANVCVCTPL